MVIAVVDDPDGRPVVLTLERWAHIIRPDGHRELWSLQTAVLGVVAHPTQRLSGRRNGEEWFLAADVGPSNWLQVVVAYESNRGRIITAFARRKAP